MKTYIIPKPGFSYVTTNLVVKFGGMHDQINKNGKAFSIPIGVAHFLEHSLFERGDGTTIFDYYKNNGTECNAYTHHEYTRFEISSFREHEKNIAYLLDYVQTPYFNEHNLKKQMNIIEQEINMYLDNNFETIHLMTMDSVFHHDTYKNDILGSVSDINQITLDILNKCYEEVYHPSNMFMVITGDVDPEAIFNFISKHQNKKAVPKFNYPLKVNQLEPREVRKDYSEKNIGLEVPLINYAIKIPRDISESKETDLYIDFICHMFFRPSSKFVMSLKEKGIITYIENFLETTETSYIIILQTETSNYKEFKKEIDNYIKTLKVTDDNLILSARVLQKEVLDNYDNVYDLNTYLLRNIALYNDPLIDRYNQIKNIKKQKITEYIKKVDFNQTSLNIVK